MGELSVFLAEMVYATIEWSGTAWCVKGQVPVSVIQSFLRDPTKATQNYHWEDGWRLPKSTVLPLLFDKMEAAGFLLVTAVGDMKGHSGHKQQLWRRLCLSPVNIARRKIPGEALDMAWPE